MTEPQPTELPRRRFLSASLAGAGALALGGGSAPRAAAPAAPPRAVAGPHTLPDLPYAQDALAPAISSETLGFHWGKHHRGYVDNLNKLLAGDEALSALPLEELVRKTAGDAGRSALFNNAAQVWNHTFYWSSMRPDGGGAPAGRLAELVDASFGGLAGFKEAFATAAKAQFGSGWTWLVEEGGKLSVEKTGNADTPMARGKRCLLTCDVWEHAYYLDWQNRRADYVTAFLDRLVSWEFAARNLS